MKKFLLAVALVAGFACANAEEVSYAPKAGSFSTEVSFNPFSGSDVFTNNSILGNNGGIFSGAYFVTDKIAVTFDFGLGGTNEKNPTLDQDNGKELGYDRKYEGEFNLGLGVKYYFYNYKRINLYAGAKVYYLHQFAGNKSFEAKTDDTPETWSWSNEGTGNGFGVYAITGIDFHIYKGLFLGAELNVGFKDTVFCGVTEKSYNGETTEVTKSKVGGHNLEGGFGVTPMFRIGWAF